MLLRCSMFWTLLEQMQKRLSEQLYHILKKRIGFSFDAGLRQILFKCLAASTGMVVVAFWIWERWFAFHPTFIKMIFIGCLGALLYIGFLWLLKVEELKGFLSWLQKKR